jgi:hypothetical protein
MKRFRVSIAGLMAMIVFAAIGIAALRYPTPLAASLLLTATLTILAVATLAAVFRRGDARAFWAGFAVAGWGYLGLCYGPLADPRVHQRLATTALLNGLYGRLAYAPRAEGEAIWYDAKGESYPARVIGIEAGPGGIHYALQVDYNRTLTQHEASPDSMRAIDLEGYRVLGHSLFCPVVAILGGIAAGLLAARDKRPTPTSDVGETPCVATD